MNILLLVATTVFFFGSWPVVGRLSGMPSAQMIFLVNIITVIVTGVAAMKSPLPQNVILTGTMILLASVAGVMNSIGHLGFGKIITYQESMLPMGIMMSLVPAMALAAGAVAGEQKLNLPQVGGITLVVFGIFIIVYFATPKEVLPQQQIIQHIVQAP